MMHFPDFKKTLKRLARWFLLTLPLSCPVAMVSAAENDGVAGINQLKVAFVYNFSKYFTWPDSPKWADSDQFSFCIHDNSVADGNFASLLTQMTQNRIIVVRDAPRDAQAIIDQCHIWYVDNENYAGSRLLLEEIRNADVLTISDMAGSSQENIVIELMVVNNRIQFRINNGLIADKGLNASSFLLRLARED